MKRIFKCLLPASFRWELRKRFLQLRGLWYRGNKYHCPCCDKNYRAFLPMKEGSFARPEVVCPGCGVVERHRLLLLFLKARTDLYDIPHRVLYFAPEYSTQAHLKRQPNIEYLSADLNSSLAMQQFDIMDIPHPDASFSVIFCSHVLAHVRDDLLALRELFRILRPGGYMIVLDKPVDIPHTLEKEGVSSGVEREKVYGQSDRWRLFGKDFPDRIASVGFEVEVDSFAKSLPDAVIEECRLDREEVIYICRKS